MLQFRYSFCERQVRHLGRQIRHQVGQAENRRIIVLLQYILSISMVYIFINSLVHIMNAIKN